MQFLGCLGPLVIKALKCALIVIQVFQTYSVDNSFIMVLLLLVQIYVVNHKMGLAVVNQLPVRIQNIRSGVLHNNIF